MNSISTRPDLSQKITKHDLMTAMDLLGSLPFRTNETSQAALTAYWIALEGSSRFGLDGAVRNILRGSLRHSFAPNPVEFRNEVDKIERPIREQAAYEAARYREAQDGKRLASVRSTITPEAKSRITVKLQAMHKSFETYKASENLALRPLDGKDPFERSNQKFAKETKLGWVSTGSAKP